MNVHLIRQYFPTHTFGILVLENGSVFHTLERPWLNNLKNQSCIPADSYKSTFLLRSSSGKYRNVWHVQSVSGRSGILFHHGNLVHQTRGCILLGMKRGTLAGKPAVLRSRSAMRGLLREIGKNPFQLIIHGDTNGLANSSR